MKYAVPRGTRDILPDETPLWQGMEEACRKVFGLYNYQEIRTPIFESTELFTRSIGRETDIVGKEMYTFADRKGRSLSLRPEQTASVVRAGLENNLIGPDKVTKLYYIGPMFRYERPQKGRQRQFHQAGVEVFGSAGPLVDVEVIGLNLEVLKAVGLTDLEVNLNSVGCAACQPVFRQKLKSYFQKEIDKMCPDCRTRFDKNPLRILDCKEPKCQPFIKEAPAAIESLCPDCQIHFAGVTGGLGDLGIRYSINKRLVRGLDYYTRTAFEVVSGQLGAQNAVSGGGRYDNLVAEFGGPSTPAVGFAIGLERVVELLNQSRPKPARVNWIDLFVAALGDEARKKALQLMQKVRSKGVSSDMDYLGRSLKAQMKTADKVGAKKVLILGDEELKKQSGILKDMESGEQREIGLDSLEKGLK